MRGHGERKVYRLVNDDYNEGGQRERFYTDISLSDERAGFSTLSREEFITAAPAEAYADAEFKFGWMFRDDKAVEVKDEEAIKNGLEPLIKLGQLMNKEPGNPGATAGGDNSDSNIPSGYTYFGQFLAHEITFDEIPIPPQSTVAHVRDVPQKRSPSIDCDSLYGAGPKGPNKSPELYQEESDGSRVRLKIGETVQSPLWSPSLMRDLPRGKAGAAAHVAIIGDVRNDENLALAQMHVAFILFHNKVVDELSVKYAGQELFLKAREQVIRHLQWIVLEDYLPRIIEKDVLKRVVDYAREHNGKLKYFDTNTAGMFMPVEFSAAAFRLGHSMIRNTYEWNYFHKTKKSSGPATLTAFFFFTGFCGTMDDKKNLMSEWIIDWKRFFDFSEIGENPYGLEFNKAKKIDTKFNFPLDKLAGYPFQPKDKALRSITVRNLMRGFHLRLPTGQAVASRLKLLANERLTPEILAASSDAEINQHLKESGLDKNTPLWYYILREAEWFHKGLKLGPVGSRIVAETFVGIIWNSDHSILKDGGTPMPALGNRKDEGKFDMIDMLKYTFDTSISALEDKNE